MLSYQTPRKGRFSLAGLLSAFGALALLAAWLVPNHYPPWTSFHGELAAFVALVLFCLATLADGNAITFDKPLAVFAAIGLLIGVQWATGQIAYSGDAIVSCLYISGLAMAWWLGTNSTRTATQLKVAVLLFAAICVAGASLATFVALLQWLRLESMLGVFATDLGPGMRPFANFGQPNHLATFALMGIVQASILYESNHLRKWQWILLVIYLSLGLVATQSRAGLASSIVLGVFFIFYSRKFWTKNAWKIVPIWWAGLLVATLCWPSINEALYLQSGRGTLSAQDQPRILMWKQMASAIEQSPWVGYGWRQTVVAQKSGANFVAGNLPTDYAHSLPIDLLLWVGVPGGILIMLAMLWWLVRTVKRMNSPAEFLLLAGVIPVCFHSFLEFPFAYSYFLFPVGWMLGAVSAQQQYRQTAVNWEIQPYLRIASITWLLAFSALSFWVATEYFRTEEDYQVMRFELRRVGNIPVNHAKPELQVLTQLGAVLNVGRMVPSLKMPPESLEAMRVANANLSWATLQLNYAVALGLNGEPQEATRQLANLRAVYGEKSYQQAKDVFLNLRREKYPELDAVVLP